MFLYYKLICINYLDLDDLISTTDYIPIHNYIVEWSYIDK